MLYHEYHQHSLDCAPSILLIVIYLVSQVMTTDFQVESRNKIFMDAFNHISDNIDKIYNELTKSNIHGVGGTTYMNLENPDEPYLGGINYIAMSQTLENLSGDEKTVAALALLFSIHRY